MKVLFVNNFNGPDYLNDMVYHGLIDCKYDVYETAYPSYMLKNYVNINSLYGKGFSIFGKLEHQPNVETELEIRDKIVSKFYDVIIYGSIHRDQSYLDLVISKYSKNEIHIIDGEDHNSIHDVIQYSTYWKRELVDNKSNANPISFCIPESQLTNDNISKEKIFGHIIPGNSSTYIFDNEQLYYHDYKISYYGITCKKAGWDCMRHYEILANKCIPYFTDIDYCPDRTMINFPKNIIKETNQYASKNLVHPNYDEINELLFDYTKNNLTTKQIVKTILC
jgi:hypothetical protein